MTKKKERKREIFKVEKFRKGVGKFFVQYSEWLNDMQLKWNFTEINELSIL
jgi:hypothetical protein